MQKLFAEDMSYVGLFCKIVVVKTRQRSSSSDLQYLWSLYEPIFIFTNKNASLRKKAQYFAIREWGSAMKERKRVKAASGRQGKIFLPPP